MEQRELCLLHGYRDSDFILKKAQAHRARVTVELARDQSPPLWESGTHLSDCLSACLFPLPSALHGVAAPRLLGLAHGGVRLYPREAFWSREAQLCRKWVVLG